MATVQNPRELFQLLPRLTASPNIALSLIPVENSAPIFDRANHAFRAYSIGFSIVVDGFPERPDADLQYSAD